MVKLNAEKSFHCTTKDLETSVWYMNRKYFADEAECSLWRKKHSRRERERVQLRIG